MKKANKVKGTADNPGMPLNKQNYILMAAGLILIVLGFILMSGGGSSDPDMFDYSMFSFRRITLAPVLVLAGLSFEVYAIMKRPGDKNSEGK